MKTTVNVSLCGRAFIMDEDAQRMLTDYLNDIKGRLHSDSERREVMIDIEARCAEIFSTSINPSIQSVNTDMVRGMIKQIGEPHYFGEPEESRNNTRDVPPPFTHAPLFDRSKLRHQRRWMRNPNDSILGGVCSGTAAYLGIETSIIRILLVILLFCYGFGLIPYLILWIILPTPTSNEDFEMFNKKRRL